MKNLFTITLAVMITAFTQAQNYSIGFIGTGAATTINSVEVENLTQGTKITLNGSEELQLVETITAIQQMNAVISPMVIYPNPADDYSNLDFYAHYAGKSSLEIYDLAGKILMQKLIDLPVGGHSFRITGLKSGIYFIRINSSAYNYCEKLFFRSNSDEAPAICYLGLTGNPDLIPKFKNTDDQPKMIYNHGDRLKYTATSGNYKTIVTDIPTSNKTILFNFTDCTDGNGNHYPVVEIGNQIWMAENLAYLPSVVGPGTGSLTTPCYYVYDYNGTNVTSAKATANYNTYGVLYNWPAAMAGSASSNANPSAVQGVCPTGWHLPSDAECTELIDYLGGADVAGGKLKATGTSELETGLWYAPNTGATNETGFTVIPGGYRDSNGTFALSGKHGYWWSSASESATNNAWRRGVSYGGNGVGRHSYNKGSGFPVRCIKGEVNVPTQVLKIHFLNMYVNDDLEGGSGDWRIYIKINGFTKIYISKHEAGKGHNVPINQTIYTDPSWNQVAIEFTVYEQDGEDWQIVDTKSATYQKTGTTWPDGVSGTKQLVIKEYEGWVTFNYSISIINQ